MCVNFLVAAVLFKHFIVVKLDELYDDYTVVLKEGISRGDCRKNPCQWDNTTVYHEVDLEQGFHKGQVESVPKPPCEIFWFYLKGVTSCFHSTNVIFGNKLYLLHESHSIPWLLFWNWHIYCWMRNQNPENSGLCQSENVITHYGQELGLIHC